MTNKKDSWIEKDVVAAWLECSEEEVDRLVVRGKLTNEVVNKKELYDPEDVGQLREERENSRRNLVFSTAEDLDKSIESIEFINKPWLPKGLVTLLIASPGLGKSKLALDVTSRILNPAVGWFDGKALEVSHDD